MSLQYLRRHLPNQCFIYILANEGNCTSLVNMQKGAIGEIDKWGDPFWVKIVYK